MAQNKKCWNIACWNNIRKSAGSPSKVLKKNRKTSDFSLSWSMEMLHKERRRGKQTTKDFRTQNKKRQR